MLAAVLAILALGTILLIGLIILRPPKIGISIIATLATVALLCVVGILSLNDLWPTGNSKVPLHGLIETTN